MKSICLGFAIVLMFISKPLATNADDMRWTGTIIGQKVFHCFPFLADDILGSVRGVYGSSQAPRVYAISERSFNQLLPSDVKHVWDGSLNDPSTIIFDKVGPPKSGDGATIALGLTQNPDYIAFWNVANEYGAIGFLRRDDRSVFSDRKLIKIPSLNRREGSLKYEWVLEEIPTSYRLDRCGMTAITVKSATPVGPYTVDSFVFERIGEGFRLVAELASEAV